MCYLLKVERGSTVPWQTFPFLAWNLIRIPGRCVSLVTILLAHRCRITEVYILFRVSRSACSFRRHQVVVSLCTVCVCAAVRLHFCWDLEHKPVRMWNALCSACWCSNGLQSNSASANHLSHSRINPPSRWKDLLVPVPFRACRCLIPSHVGSPNVTKYGKYDYIWWQHILSKRKKEKGRLARVCCASEVILYEALRMDKVITYFLAAFSVLVVPIRGQVFKGKNSKYNVFSQKNGRKNGKEILLWVNLSASSRHVCCSCDQIWHTKLEKSYILCSCFHVFRSMWLLFRLKGWFMFYTCILFSFSWWMSSPRILFIWWHRDLFGSVFTIVMSKHLRVLECRMAVDIWELATLTTTVECVTAEPR